MQTELLMQEVWSKCSSMPDQQLRCGRNLSLPRRSMHRIKDLISKNLQKARSSSIDQTKKVFLARHQITRWVKSDHPNRTPLTWQQQSTLLTQPPSSTILRGRPSRCTVTRHHRQIQGTIWASHL